MKTRLRLGTRTDHTCQRLLRLWCLLMLGLLLRPTTARAQGESTLFIAHQGQSFSANGDWWVQGFTVNGTRSFVLRFASDYRADAAVITPDQLDNFKNSRGFSGYAVFDDQFGTKSVTLGAGSYYVAIRNQNNGDNTCSVELDYAQTLPDNGSESYSFYDNYFNGSTYVNARGGKLWQGFSVQSGFRYFIDGCNSGLESYIISANEIENFKNGSSFQYYTSYASTSGDGPGMWEIKLPPGTYYLALRNTADNPKAVTYLMQRWRINGFNPGPNPTITPRPTVTPVPPSNVLNAPTNLRANAVSSNAIALSWQDTNASESGYLLERKIGASGSWSSIRLAANATSFTNGSLISGVDYYYRVRALSGSAPNFAFGPLSEEVSARIGSNPNPNPPPNTGALQAPANLRATALSATSIGVSWQDTNTSESGYLLERKANGDNGWTARLVLSANTTSFTNNGLIAGVTFIYRVTALSGSAPNFVLGPPSPEVSAGGNGGGGTTGDELVAPTNFAANFVAGRGVVLSWQDSNVGIAGYQIDRRESGSAAWIGRLFAPTLSASDAYALPGKTYFYRIRAVKGSAPNYQFGPYSSEVSIEIPSTNNNATHEYVLAGATVDETLAGDDYAEIYLNGVLIWSHNFFDHPVPQVRFTAKSGDTLRVVVSNDAGAAQAPALYLHRLDNGDRTLLSDGVLVYENPPSAFSSTKPISFPDQSALQVLAGEFTAPQVLAGRFSSSHFPFQGVRLCYPQHPVPPVLH